MADATLDPLALVTCVTISTLAKNYLSKDYLKMDSVLILSDWATYNTPPTFLRRASIDFGGVHPPSSSID